MIKILHILKSLDIGGMERLVVRLANKLNDSEIESHICSIDKLGTIAKDFGHPEKLIVLNNKGRINAKSVISIQRYVSANSIDVIHAHNTAGLLYGFFPALLKRKPIIYTLHGLERDYETINMINRLEKWLSLHVSAYVCVSEQLAQYVSCLFGIDHGKMHVIYNGVVLPSNEDRMDRANN